VDLLVGVGTVLLGLGFVAVPWVFQLTGNGLASATIVAGGIIVALVGLGLARQGGRRR